MRHPPPSDTPRDAWPAEMTPVVAVAYIDAFILQGMSRAGFLQAVADGRAPAPMQRPKDAARTSPNLWRRDDLDRWHAHLLAGMEI